MASETEVEAENERCKRERWTNPRWNEAGRVHDWRNYISERVRALWPSFTDEQKEALFEQAEEQADREEWE